MCKKIGAGVIFLLLGSALAGPADNSLIIGTTQEPTTVMDFWQTSGMRVVGEIDGFMTARLVYRNNSGELLPEIAERVPSLENGDYKIYKVGGKVLRNSVTYRIRKDARWSDGTPITSKDFKFWLEVAKDKNVPMSSRFPWDKSEISITNDQVFTINFSPAYLFATSTPPSLAPVHIMESGYKAFKIEIKGGGNASDLWARYINSYTGRANISQMVVSGPFKPHTWIPGQGLRLRRNPNYWRIPEGGFNKYIQTVIYKFISNSNTLRLNAMSNQLDATSSVGLTFDQTMGLFKSSNNSYEPVLGGIGAYEYIAIAQEGEQAKKLGLTDKRVRLALTYGINRSEAINVLFGGYVKPASTWVAPSLPMFNKDLFFREYNPDKARRLLGEAGWKPGPDGILVKDGVKMVLKFSTTAGNVIRERIQQIFKDQWRKIGVEVKIENYPGNVLFSDSFLPRCENGNWDLILMGNGASDAINYEGNVYSTASIPNASNSYAGLNHSKYSNPLYDELWNKSHNEFDIGKRTKLFNEMQKVVYDDAASIFLHEIVGSYIRAKDLVNLSSTVQTRLLSWDAYRIGWSSLGAVKSE